MSAAHGAQKLFGWFGGHGVKGTGGFLESLGWRPGRSFALLLGVAGWATGLVAREWAARTDRGPVTGQSR